MPEPTKDKKLTSDNSNYQQAVKDIKTAHRNERKNMIKEILAYECTICGAVYKNPEDTDKHVCLKTPLKKLSEYKKVIMAATRLEEWMVDSIGKLTSDCPDDVWGPFEKALEDIRKRHFRKNK